jgi:lysophospholipase L1-like esterase
MPFLHLNTSKKYSIMPDKIIRRRFWLLALVMLGFGMARAQDYRFQKEISQFKTRDSTEFPPAGEILFVGSSSFAKWKDVQDYFPGYPILNRGFGGSTLPDVIHYAGDVIIPYHPRQIIIYCGDNDLASSDTVTAVMVLDRFRKLFALIREKLPRTFIGFISIKPSQSRQRLMPRMVKANGLIKDFLKGRKNTAFINVYDKMLNGEGMPDSSIFLKDELHMNAKGYAIWQRVIEPYLLKN